MSIHLNGELVKTVDYSSSSGQATTSQPGEERGREGGEELARGDCIYRLDQLAYLRSGDKGNTANIGVCTETYNLQVLFECTV